MKPTIFLEKSLSLSRNPRIKSACSDLDLLVSEHTASEVSPDEAAQKEKAAIEATINVVLTVKKIKRDLHIQWVELS